MICIFSSERDLSTTEVMRWLLHLGVTDVLRVNHDDPSHDRMLELNVDENTLAFRLGGRLIRLSEIDAVWYRKGRQWLCDQFLEVDFSEHPKFAAYIRKKLAAEQLRLSEYVHFTIENTVPALGSSGTSNLNKLLVLHEARKVGLLVPTFCISNSKAFLRAAVAGRRFITKPISDVLYLFDATDANVGYYSYTEAFAESALDVLPDRISPSLVQEQIVKKFDVRVFVLDGRCYPMAIFSQADERTRIDFRRYNYAKPNRSVPLRLPSDVETKLVQLLRVLNLNTGSADFIVDQEGRFFFLEINPTGQFEMVSIPCGYLVEKQIALTLRTYARQDRDKPAAN
jgi:ATP-GRASP peptide maturase of grasp-with-spasm system